MRKVWSSGRKSLSDLNGKLSEKGPECKALFLFCVPEMLLIYTHIITSRLQYVVDFLSKELFDEPIQITSNIEQFKAANAFRLVYAAEPVAEEVFFIKNHPLLFEQGIQPQSIRCFEVNNHKAFFATAGDFPFDILAAIFYLLSRYEEYLPHEKDMYGRYSHTNSLAWREGFLHLPLINIWLEQLKKALQQHFPDIRFRRNQFKCALSYDIDMAWSYQGKGVVRMVGGFARSLLKGEWRALKERWQVLTGSKKDPYDCFEWLDALHLYCRLKPYYFFLVAQSPSQYDKNISPKNRRFQNLVTYYGTGTGYKIGLHPSWSSGDNPALLQEEREWLEVMAGKAIIHSRQHYIRFTLPETFRRLVKAGIQKDFSMGYGTINGFRASVCSSFSWYDLEAEQTSPLLLYPYCFMDANSYYEQKHTPKQAYEELLAYYERVKQLKGLFITIWHNAMLGTDAQFAGWRDMFELFMKETVYWDAYMNAE